MVCNPDDVEHKERELDEYECGGCANKSDPEPFVRPAKLVHLQEVQPFGAAEKV